MRPSIGAAGVAVALLAGGCAARGGFVPPQGAGTPLPEAARLFADATRDCAAIESLTAEASLSGRVDRGRVRGRLHLGLTRTGQIRVEAVAPFGQPIFTLAGDAQRATLWLPRDGRVLRDVPPAEILEALAGVALSPVDFLQLATGCFGAGQQVTRGERFSSGLIRFATADGIDVWARPAAAPRPIAAARGEVWAEYVGADAGAPTALRLVRRDAAQRPVVDLRLSFAQQERNAAIDAAAFAVDVPATAAAITIGELRQSQFLR